MLRQLAKRRQTCLVALLILIIVGLVVGRARLVFVPRVFARRCLADRRLDDALWWLGCAKRISPTDAETEFLFARAYRKAGSMDRARPHLKQATELGHPMEAAQREQWLALAQSGQMREAEPQLAPLLIDSRGDGAEICEAYVIGYLRIQQITKAGELLRLWVADFPHDPQPHFYLGAIEENHNAWQDAIDCYQRTLANDAKHHGAALAIANCYLLKKEPQAALDYFELAAKGSTEQVAALVGQARCLREFGKADEARIRLELALSRDPHDGAAILEMAHLDLEAADFEAAERRLEPLVSREPRNHDARFAYATALRSTGKAEEARRHFETVFEARSQLTKATNLAEQLKGSGDTELRHQIGAIYLKYDDPKEGLFWLMSVLEYDPNHKATHKALADFYANKQGEDPQFAALAERYRDLSQD